MPFEKGVSGNAEGRPKGSKNKINEEYVALLKDISYYKEILGELASHQAEVVGNEIRKRFGVFKGSDFSIKNPLK